MLARRDSRLQLISLTSVVDACQRVLGAQDLKTKSSHKRTKNLLKGIQSDPNLSSERSRPAPGTQTTRQPLVGAEGPSVGLRVTQSAKEGTHTLGKHTDGPCYSLFRLCRARTLLPHHLPRSAQDSPRQNHPSCNHNLRKYNDPTVPVHLRTQTRTLLTRPPFRTHPPLVACKRSPLCPFTSHSRLGTNYVCFGKDTESTQESYLGLFDLKIWLPKLTDTGLRTRLRTQPDLPPVVPPGVVVTQQKIHKR